MSEMLQTTPAFWKHSVVFEDIRTRRITKGSTPRHFFVAQGASEDIPNFNNWPFPKHPNEMLAEEPPRPLSAAVQKHPRRVFRYVSPCATPSGGGAFNEDRIATAALGEQLAIHSIHKSEIGKRGGKARKR
jgi:hypothetical protein